MKQALYFLFKYYVRLGLYVYFQKIRILGMEKLPEACPSIWLPNHQNALIDALILATCTDRRPYFLTRSDVFANRLLKVLFRSLQMIPVYRMRDGRRSLTKNREVFERCADLLRRGEILVIFPEANHNLQRRVRPLSKGFTRIILKAFGPGQEPDIRLIPIGVNYVDAAGFPDRAAVYFGSAISVLKFRQGREPEAFASALTSEIFHRLTKLTTHIDTSRDYDTTIAHLEEEGVDFLKPQEVNALAAGISKGVAEPRKKATRGRMIWDIVFGIWNLPVVLLWKAGIRHMVTEAEFTGTVRFLFALVAYPLLYVLFFLALAPVVGIAAAFFMVLVHFLLNLCYVKLR